MARMKDIKAPAPASKPDKSKSGAGKPNKKKWNKVKKNDKVSNMVLFDRTTYDKFITEAPKFKLLTPSILSDKLRVVGSLARKAIKDLEVKGLSRMVSSHASQQMYTRATNI